MTTTGMKRVLISGTNKTEAIAELSSYGGSVPGLKLASGVFAGLAPPAYIAAKATESTTTEDEEQDAAQVWLETCSALEAKAWETFQSTTLTTVERPLSLSITGSAAVALLIVSAEPDDLQFTDSEISDDILAGLYNGVSSLQVSYPDQLDDIQIVPYHATISPSSKVPDVGVTSWPSPVAFQDKLYCFFQGNSFYAKSLMYNVFDPSTSSWEGKQQVSSVTITDGPSAVVFNEKLYVFHSGQSSRHEIWYSVFDGTTWTSDARIPNTRITGGPSAVVYDGKIYCFHQGYTNNDNELWYNVFDGDAWAGDKLVSDTLITESPSAVVFGDKIFCFYQGVDDLANTLLVNRFDPSTQEWSGHVAVPYSESITGGPSALSFDSKIYVFHLSGDTGALWFNTSSDGSFWRGDIPLAPERATAGVGTTVFQDALFCCFQGADDNVQALMYRSFAAGTLEWESLWAVPALASLGYASFAELAEAVRAQTSADNGYVACVTKLPLLYSAYADETRVCIEYPTSDIATTFAKGFSAVGVYDRSTDSSGDPRYTFALMSAQNNTVPIVEYSMGFVFHQGVSNTGQQLWFSLLDRRTSNWTEMQGPVTSLSTSGQAEVFISESKLYVFYEVSGALYYNILDGVTWKGEAMVPDIQGITASPGAVLYKDKIYCFYQGADSNGQLWYNVLDTETDTWAGESQLALQADEYDSDGNLTFHTELTLGPCPAVFVNYVYNLYNGGVLTTQDQGQLKTGRLRVNVFNGSGAITDMQIPNTYLTAEPSAVVYNEMIYAFHQGSKSDGSLWYNTNDGSSSTWDGDKELALEDGLLISDGPSAMALQGKLFCFFRGKGTSLVNLLWYNVLDGDSGWVGQKILPTGSGIGAQHDALAIGSLIIDYDTTPPTVTRSLE